MIPYTESRLEGIPLVKHDVQVSFLPMTIALLFRFAGFVPLEILRITKGVAFGAPRLIWRVGVHPDDRSLNNNRSGSGREASRSRDAVVQPNVNKRAGRNKNFPPNDKLT